MNTIEFYNLSVEMRQLLAFVEENGGELTPEVEERLQELALDTAGQIEQIVLAIRELDGSAEAIGQVIGREGGRLAKRRKSKQNSADLLRGLVADHMAQTGQDRVKTDLVTVSLVKGDSKPLWEGKDETIPDEYCRVLTERRLDEAKVKAARAEGLPLPDGIRFRPTHHVRIT